MNNFQKAFKDIQTFINRRRGGRKKDEDEDDEANDGEEFNGDKDDEKPGDTKLNGGEHGKIFGINRKIVTGVILTAFLIVSMATYSAINNHREQEDARKAQPTMAAEEASDQNNRKDGNGYDALFRQNQKAALAKNGQNGQNPQNPNGVNGANSANGNVTVARPQGNVTVATPTSATPTVTRPGPAIADVPTTQIYTTPYTLRLLLLVLLEARRAAARTALLPVRRRASRNATSQQSRSASVVVAVIPRAVPRKRALAS